MDYKKHAKNLIEKANQCSISDLEQYLYAIGYKVVYADTAQGRELLKGLKLFRKAKRNPAFTYSEFDINLVIVRQQVSKKQLRYLLLHELGHIMCEHNLACISETDEAEANCFADWCLIICRLPRRQAILRSAYFVTAALLVWAGIAFAHDSTTTVYVTKSGEKYHKASCVYVQKKETATPITLIIAKKRNYEPCAVCFGAAHKI